ncbi:MAG: Lar family restriction alleviation protein, partial [Bacteroidales bacterium]|nr:Lar family restriction alleviation protein [Bacteroidales bacterium]
GKASMCPFCGGPAEVRLSCGRYGVQCTRTETCGAVAYFDLESESSAKTVSAWLKRRSMRSIEAENPMEGPFFNPFPGAYPQTLKRIRPCPFCGGRVMLAGLDSGDGPCGAVRCGTCKVTVMFRSADGPENMCDIVDRWDRRDGEEI